MKHVYDQLADTMNNIVLKHHKLDPTLSAEVGLSHTALDMAVHAFRRRAQDLAYSDATLNSLVSDARVDYVRAANKCDSPIEKTVLPWLIFADYANGTAPGRVYLPDSDDVLPLSSPIVIVPQMRIGRFRLDFLVVATKGDTEKSLFAFECDGDAFHGTRKDEGRDISLAQMGILTIRASGKEIYARPGAAVDRLAFRVRNWMAA